MRIDAYARQAFGIVGGEEPIKVRLVRWVLSWMPDVKVLAPKSLRDRIAEKLQDGLRAQQ